MLVIADRLAVVVGVAITPVLDEVVSRNVLPAAPDAKRVDTVAARQVEGHTSTSSVRPTRLVPPTLTIAVAFASAFVLPLPTRLPKGVPLPSLAARLRPSAYAANALVLRRRPYAVRPLASSVS